MSEIVTTSSESPFDGLMGEDGRWSARHLAARFGYARWSDVRDGIGRAKAAIDNTGGEGAAQDHIEAGLTMIATGKGARREVEDFRLTRYGAYMWAMNGDPRKREIAAAQTYFAVKTRQAEVGSTPELPQTYAQALRAAADAAEAQERAELEASQAKQALAITAPKAEVYDEWLTSEAIEMTDFAKRIKFTPPRKFTATLRAVGILRKDKTHTGRYRNLPTKAWEYAFEVRPVELPTGDWIDLALVNAQGQVDIHEELRDLGYDV